MQPAACWRACTFIQGRTSTPKLHILMVEDSDADAELAVHALQKADITFSSKRVDTEPALRRELRERPPDLILSDYDLQGFDGISALMIARKLVPSTPCYRG